MAEKSGFDGAGGEDFMKRSTWTRSSKATVAMSAAQNHGLIQRGSVWSSRYSAKAMQIATSGTSPASV